MWELTKSFRFEAAHTLKGTTLGAGSEEIHGHSFRAEVAVRGKPDPATGMMVDLGMLEQNMADIRKLLDHKLLNNVAALELPTLENLAAFIWERVHHAGQLTRVTVIAIAATRAAAISGRRTGVAVMTTSPVIEDPQGPRQKLVRGIARPPPRRIRKDRRRYAGQRSICAAWRFERKPWTHGRARNAPAMAV